MFSKGQFYTKLTQSVVEVTAELESCGPVTPNSFPSPSSTHIALSCTAEVVGFCFLASWHPPTVLQFILCYEYVILIFYIYQRHAPFYSGVWKLHVLSSEVGLLRGPSHHGWWSRSSDWFQHHFHKRDKPPISRRFSFSSLFHCLSLFPRLFLSLRFSFYLHLLFLWSRDNIIWQHNFRGLFPLTCSPQFS
jgi:hypothetical protein